jgi:hypothetical protein
MKKIKLLGLLVCLMSRAFAGSHNGNDGKNKHDWCNATITVTPSTATICSGGQNLTASGGVSYIWSDGETTSVITVSPSSTTTYTVTGTDAGGCTGTASAVVNVDNVSASLSVAYSQTCNGLPAIFSATISGGSGPFTYSWYNSPQIPNGQESGLNGGGGSGGGNIHPVSSGLTDTIYSYASTSYDVFLEITDANGCQIGAGGNADNSYAQGFTVFVPDGNFCNDYGNKQLNAIQPYVFGGQVPYTYRWNDGETTQAMNPNSSGTYTVVVTDASGCSETATSQVFFWNAPTVTVTSSSNGLLPHTADTLKASGAQKYYWSNGSTADQLIVTPRTNANYSVFGWDTVKIGRILAGCGSPWQSIPVIVATNTWIISHYDSASPLTSPIYDLGNVAIGLQIPTSRLEVDGTITADSILKVGKVTGQGININGVNSTITSPSNTVSFSVDTVSTTSSLKTPLILFQDPINNPGGFSSITGFGPGNTNISEAPCHCVSPAKPMTFNSCGYIFGGIPPLTVNPPLSNNTFMGIGTSAPDAGLSISTACSNEFSVITPNTTTDVFTIDPSGNTFIGGNTYAVGNIGIGTASPDAVLSVANPASPLSYQFSINNSTSDVFNIDKMGNTYIAGNVGIGTSSPTDGLDVVNNSGPSEVHVSSPTNNNNRIWVANSLYAYGLGVDATTGNGAIYGNIGTPYEIMTFDLSNQNIGIGTSTPGHTLDVNGTIRSNEIMVCSAVGGCDFVFDKDYKLMPLDELENYLNLNHHLPGIPSAKEMESSDGVALGKMNNQLLQKVEELTLYTIQLKKQLDDMQEQIDKMKEGK